MKLTLPLLTHAVVSKGKLISGRNCERPSVHPDEPELACHVTYGRAKLILAVFGSICTFFNNLKKKIFGSSF
jgi:hypothetical protein